MSELSEVIKITTSCPVCHKSTDIEVVKLEYLAWRSGMFIQEAMPGLSPDKREQLMSGICSECWTKLFEHDG